MVNRHDPQFDILCAGELLVDFISTGYAETLNEARSFERHMGGSPANLCMNMARLGNRARLAASVGSDDMGNFLVGFVKKTGVDCSLVSQVGQPTTLILVTKTRTVANFEAYRGADAQIGEAQLPLDALRQCAIFHTTCFALSKAPASASILNAAELAAAHGSQLSLDANFAGKIWPDQREAQRVVSKFCNLGAIVKVSEVDWERLYGEPLKQPDAAAAHFLKLGASLVCVTMGGDGAFVASQNGREFLPARPVDVKDTTGAGDAFWSGFLTAWLDGHSPLNCAKAGRSMAELKIGRFGPLPDVVDKALIYKDL